MAGSNHQPIIQEINEDWVRASPNRKREEVKDFTGPSKIFLSIFTAEAR
jgi:hypothetical protein